MQQLALTLATVQLEKAEVGGLVLPPPPKSLLDQIEAATADSTPSASTGHKEVSKALDELGITHEMEVSPFKGETGSRVNFNAGGMLNIDIVIEGDMNKKLTGKEGDEKLRVVMDFNGPTHYVRCEGKNVESGRTKFKRRLVEGLGFTVKSIYWDDWRACKDVGEQKAYLKGVGVGG